MRLISCRIDAGDTHDTGSLRATPRGSKLTRLKADLREAGKPFAFCSRKSTPEPPGPPGFVTMSPRAPPGPLAGSCTKASERLPAPGSEYEIGTFSVPHWKCPTDVTAFAASDVQVVQTIGDGFGSEDGAVRGVVLGSVVADAGAVVLAPDPLRPKVNELDPHAARPVDTSTATASAPRVKGERQEYAPASVLLVGRPVGGTCTTLCPGCAKAAAPHTCESGQSPHSSPRTAVPAQQFQRAVVSSSLATLDKCDARARTGATAGARRCPALRAAGTVVRFHS